MREERVPQYCTLGVLDSYSLFVFKTHMFVCNLPFKKIKNTEKSPNVKT